MEKRLLALPILLFFVFQVYAEEEYNPLKYKPPNNCISFFKNAGAFQGEPDCKRKCGSAPVGLGSYNCPRHCVRWCNFGLEEYKETKDKADEEKISNKEATKALKRNIQDLCAFANSYVIQPSITNAIDSVTKVSGSGTLLMNAGSLSRMAKAKTNRQRSHAGLELYSNTTGLGGIQAWEQAVSDFNRLSDAMDKGTSGLLELGRQMVRENKAGTQKLNPRPNLPDTCK